MTSADQPTLCDADPSALKMQDALDKILAHCSQVTSTELVDTSNAMHRVTAVDINATLSVPPFRSSAMDGYAYRHAEGSEPLSIVGTSLAGHPYEGQIPRNACVRITTGAAVPDDADTVVMQENVEVSEQIVNVKIPPTPNFNVRNIGSDHLAGQPLLSTGISIKAAEIALLASHGFDQIRVKRKLRVAVLSTGDELHRAGETLKPGGIYDSNRALLISMLQSPAIECLDAGICTDDIKSLKAAFNKIDGADIVITTGGVSVGDADFVRTALETSGEIAMWKIAMKPGRPLTFGKLDSSALFFGLPGNPVSAAITCLFFVKPTLDTLLGKATKELITVSAILDTDLRKLAGRVEYQRGILSGNAADGYRVTTTGLQDSHVLTSLQRANCLVELPLLSTGSDAGDTVTTIPFSSIGDNLI